MDNTTCEMIEICDKANGTYGMCEKGNAASRCTPAEKQIIALLAKINENLSQGSYE